ncbi:4'-phosphopantetheinyl transferase superfamily protein [Virgibacillus sp. AGTR]|uniref:4'-phosphopantetheinyl transferase family protein n=1 Tax=Virgibacillus sp. AGTR TaxID=2812055 RepID=UPI0019633CEF|nr:4'-phosphopantetheinyl transferase superfamily protein [Virgibacillus sp. AGTR]MCC2251874.1 4'-phosphopantetheinyl transferase superfamily protein [Virgibacillus sp. AGTR]QRZ17665.1 4'-phosphopantetheinyl transferase superfamily protein [Virgibacillus sp. AGTR]
MTNLYVCKLPNKRSHQEIQWLFPYISVRVQNKISRYRLIEDMYRKLIGELLLRHPFNRCTGYKLPVQKIEITQYGKPFLPAFPSFQYNISHSGDWVALATHHYPVGVDIEKIQSVESSVVKNLFSQKEYTEMLKHVRPVQAFYEIWTAKESFVKETGKGVLTPLHSFAVNNLLGSRIQFIHTSSKAIIEGYTCQQYRDINGYSLAICTTKVDEKAFGGLRFCHFNDLLNDL